VNNLVIGVDIAKRVFQLHWVEESGEIKSVQLRREKFLEHFANRAPCLVGMEACGGSQHWARELQGLGHEVKLMLSPSLYRMHWRTAPQPVYRMRASAAHRQLWTPLN
jgi:hypothetical protein